MSETRDTIKNDRTRGRGYLALAVGRMYIVVVVKKLFIASEALPD